MNRPLQRALVLLLLLLPTTLRSQEISSPTEYRQQMFDVLSYDVYLDLTRAPTPETAGNCEMVIRWVGDPSSGFYFHLRSLEIDSVFYNGVRTTAVPVGVDTEPTFHYVVPAAEGAATGDTAVVRVHYHGTMTDEGGGSPWGGVSSDNGVLYALGVGLRNNYVSATQHWMPCYDHPSDKATFSGRFLTRSDHAVASNGVGTSVRLGDSLVIHTWHTSIPTATYLLTFACGPYVALEMSGASVPIQLFSQRADTLGTRRTFSLLPRMISAYERHLGPFPFEKVGYCNTRKGAMEHQTMISFPESIVRTGDSVNSTGAHELAHQWFGDLVSPLDFRHVWLTESFATWCESLWAEELGGFAAYLESQSTKMSSYFSSDARAEGILPLYDFSRVPPSSNYPWTIYHKGAIVVGMLRYELGDSLFFRSLRAFLVRYGRGTATTEDMQNVLEETSGAGLGWFFDQWVRRPGWPVFDVNVVQQPGVPGLSRAVVTMTQSPSGTTEYFNNVPVELGFRDSAGSVEYRVVRVGGPDTIVVIDSLKPFRFVNVNKGPSLRALLQAPRLNVSNVELQDRERREVRIHVVPNPVSESSAVIAASVIGIPQCTGARYVLYDTTGREIASGTLSDCEFRIPIDDVDAGVYLLHVEHRYGMSDVTVAVGQ